MFVIVVDVYLNIVFDCRLSVWHRTGSLEQADRKRVFEKRLWNGVCEEWHVPAYISTQWIHVLRWYSWPIVIHKDELKCYFIAIITRPHGSASYLFAVRNIIIFVFFLDFITLVQRCGIVEGASPNNRRCFSATRSTQLSLSIQVISLGLKSEYISSGCYLKLWSDAVHQWHLEKEDVGRKGSLVCLYFNPFHGI